MRWNLSSPFSSLDKNREQIQSFNQQFFGLAQVTTLPGGSKTQLAFECLSYSLQADPPDPSPYFIFISDLGMVYPPALQALAIPLSRILLVKTPNADSVWKTTLEALQTGLFSFIFLRPSGLCSTQFLRKLQLSTEKAHAKVFILSDLKLPHWNLRASLIAKAPTAS